jgi:hypothetical protein
MNKVPIEKAERISAFKFYAVCSATGALMSGHHEGISDSFLALYGRQAVVT